MLEGRSLLGRIVKLERLYSTLHHYIAGRRGVRLPQLTTTERDALPSPRNGTLIYNTTTLRVEAYENGAWVDL